jgi:hypothetical protein
MAGKSYSEQVHDLRLVEVRMAFGMVDAYV